MAIQVLGLCGSARRDSLNQKLLEIALLGAGAAGASVTQIRLTDLKLTIYDGDAEAEHGLPDGVHVLKSLNAEHQALLIATPEHNGGYSAGVSRLVSNQVPNGFEKLDRYFREIDRLAPPTVREQRRIFLWEPRTLHIDVICRSDAVS